jgi:hypothetical protein
MRERSGPSDPFRIDPLRITGSAGCGASRGSPAPILHSARISARATFWATFAQVASREPYPGSRSDDDPERVAPSSGVRRMSDILSTSEPRERHRIGRTDQLHPDAEERPDRDRAFACRLDGQDRSRGTIALPGHLPPGPAGAQGTKACRALRGTDSPGIRSGADLARGRGGRHAGVTTEDVGCRGDAGAVHSMPCHGAQRWHSLFDAGRDRSAEERGGGDRARAHSSICSAGGHRSPRDPLPRSVPSSSPTPQLGLDRGELGRRLEGARLGLRPRRCDRRPARGLRVGRRSED